MRFLLALKCFFLVLFYKRLPAEAATLLPAPTPSALLPPEAELVEPTGAAQPPAVKPAPAPPVRDARSDGAVLLLGLLQREGRLLDFLQEEIESYSDAQIGAAVRDIHRGCKKALAEHAPLEPVLKEPENATVRVDPGFDPSRIRLVGNVVGEPPFTGVLKHAGWRATAINLPRRSGQDPQVIAPAEVEIG